jgi:hypothetical protein
MGVVSARRIHGVLEVKCHRDTGKKGGLHPIVETIEMRLHSDDFNRNRYFLYAVLIILARM